MYLARQKFLVAGASGLLGKAFIEKLKTKGCEKLLQPSREELDLENRDDVDAYFKLHRPDVVILSAGKVGGILENKHNPIDFLTKNLSIQLNVALAADTCNTSRVVMFGSSCMYPKHCQQPMNENMLNSGKLEETSLAYATAKLAGLQLGFAYNAQRNIDRYLCVIPNSVYGPGDNFDPQTGHVLSSLIHKFHSAKANNKPTVELFGTGLPRREFIFSLDVADAVIFLLESDIKTTRTPINIGVGYDVSITELASIVSKIVDFNGEILWKDDKPDGTFQKLLNSDRLTSLGWQPKTQLVDGVKNTYDWYLKNIL